MMRYLLKCNHHRLKQYDEIKFTIILNALSLIQSPKHLGD